MPIDYSKWDALELSDDSDIEVHPNVDKRSFIRAKQNQIHAERQQRKNQIETLKYERIINDSLIKRISSLLASLKAHAADAKTRNPGEVAFQAVMESAASIDPKDDQPPPRPAGVHGSEEPLPSYTKMLATLLDQVNRALDEKKINPDQRYSGMVAEVEEHLNKVQQLQKDLLKKLAELEKQEHSKITSADIHTGFDSSHVNKSKPKPDETQNKSSSVELLNPTFAATLTSPTTSSKPDAGGTTPTTRSDGSEEEEEIVASADARKFAAIEPESYRESAAFLTAHPHILTERDTDGLLAEAFEAQLAGQDAEARRCVHQALLLQYCRALGRDGVALFFRRVTTPGHQARDLFYKDVQDMYAKIRARAAELGRQREAGGEPDGVEQIQLHAVEPGTVINIRIPAEGTEERKIFEGFKPEMREALESGSLDEVNKVLGGMKVEEAEELVGLFGEAGILSLEEQVIDATTEEGQKRLKELEEEAAASHGAAAGAATTTESQYADDPE